MPIRVQLSGANSDHKIHQAQCHDDGTFAGLVVFAKDLVETDTQIAPFINDEYGEDINQDASLGGTPVVVHDGTDSTAWTASNVVGSRVVFDSTNRPLNGTRSVFCNRPLVNDIWQFDQGSDLAVTNYSALTLWVNIDNNWRDGTSSTIYAWDTGSGQIVGNSVTLESYVDEFQFDTWQKAVIPFTDLGLVTTNFDAIRMQFAAHLSGTRPRWYIDDMQIEQSGSPIEFRTNTKRGSTYRIDSLTFTFVDSTANTSLSYDKILEETLVNGLLLSRVVAGETTFATSLKDLRDFLKLGFDISNYQADGSNAILTLRTQFPKPLTVYGGDTSYLSVAVSEDLSGWVSATVLARGSIDL